MRWRSGRLGRELGGELGDEWRAVLFWAPVVGVAALSQSAVGTERPWTGGGLALAATTLLLCLPLLLRVSRPLVAVTVLGLGLVVQMGLGGTLHFGSFVAVLVTSYSLGRHARAAQVPIGLAVLLLGIVVAMRDSLPHQAVELSFPAFYTTAAAGAGMAIRRLSTQAADLRRLNSVLARERDISTQLAIATERIRLARDLHDAVAHSLTVSVVQAQDCEDAITTDPARAREASRRIQEVARAGLEDLRRTVRMLRNDELADSGPGVREIPALCAALGGAGLQAVIQMDGDPDRLDEQQGNTFFRVAQEGLTNVLKHSCADTATLTLEVEADEATLRITDPGPPATAVLPSGGRGLAGMAERLVQHGGTLETANDRGFTVIARLPIAGSR